MNSISSTLLTPCNTNKIGSRLYELLKEDALFWSILTLLSLSMGIICLYAASTKGWHEYYFSWTRYLLMSPSILLIKWLNQRIRFDITVLEVLSKFTIGFLLAYNVTPVLLTTSHPFIDKALLHMDTWMHINTLALLEFTKRHHEFHEMLLFCYMRLDASFILLILLLTLIGEKKLTENLLTMSLIALFVAAILFYFFPAFGPATVLKSTLFPHYATKELSEFKQVQQGLPLNLHDYFSGFVSMPSIHTFIASLAIYTCLIRKKLRWILAPIVVFNVMIIIATMFLGEHYFVDLIGAWVLLALIISCYKFFL